MLEKTKNRISELDALRGIAALLVMLFHFLMDRPEDPGFFVYGVTGVDLFFIISGFVIFLTLQQTTTWKHFVINRLTRLYPTYWASISFTALVMYIIHVFYGGQFSLSTYLGNLTMLQYYLGIDNLDGPYWTLIIEMLFYVLMLFIFLFKGLDKIEKIGYVFLIFILCNNFLSDGNPVLGEKINTAFPLIDHFPLFFAGILFYKMKFERASVLRYLGVTGCFLLSCALFDNGGASNAYIERPGYCIALACYFSLFILYVHNKLSFIVNRYTLFLGTISYSLYLIHQYVGVAVVIPMIMGKFHFSFWMAVLAAVFFCIAVAGFITFFIEKPVMRYLRKKWST